MMRSVQIVAFAILLVCMVILGQPPQTQPSALKIIREKCLVCHSGEKPANGLRLDTVDNMVKGGKNGPALVPHKPDESLIFKAISEGTMPPFYRLEEDETATVRRWIYRGAQQHSMSGQEP